MNQKYRVIIQPKIIALYLTIIALVLAIWGLALSVYLIDQNVTDGFFFKIYRWFDLNAENTFLAWYSSILLAFAALLVLMLAFYKQMANEKYKFQWFFLSLIFFFLSLDETTSIHEASSGFVRSTLHASGLLYASWIIPAGILVIIIGIWFIPFVFHLPPTIRNLVIVAGCIYLTAVIGFEAIGGLYRDTTGLYQGYDIPYMFISGIEELMEMIGAITFIYALTRYMRMIWSDVEITKSADMLTPHDYGATAVSAEYHT